MPKPRVFIDGQAGTTGLRIHEMLAGRDDLELLSVPQAERKEAGARRERLRAADLAILCLPDEAVPEALEMVEGAATRLIDVSTPRRVHPDWVYGLPELSGEQKRAIAEATRVANPGCYPMSYILSVRPLVEAGLLDPGVRLSVFGISGYSGGGRRMIETYMNAKSSDPVRDAALPISLYGLDGRHKHLPEMQKYSGMSCAPLFLPSVGHFYAGMLVSTPIPAGAFTKRVSRRDVWEVLSVRYAGEPFVKVMPLECGQALREGKYLEPQACNRTNRLELFVFGDEAQGLTLVGRLDNLGKGASGNAVQCLNLMLGLPETRGLGKLGSAPNFPDDGS